MIFRHTGTWNEDDPYVSLSQTARASDAQSSIINKHAAKGSCVIVGRCADYVLRKMSIFCVCFSTQIWVKEPYG